jgi:hypothetical protein
VNIRRPSEPRDTVSIAPSGRLEAYSSKGVSLNWGSKQRCMGVESTFRPWCWSDLGPMAPDRSITLGPIEVERGPGNFVAMGVTVWRCETDPESFLRRERE